jgi:hypothetical protein
VVRRHAAMSRTEDLDAKVCEEAITCKGGVNWGCCKAVAAAEGSDLEAITRHRHATIVDGRNDCGDDEGDRLAAALVARLSCRRGAQTPEAETRLEEDRLQSGVSDHERR